MKKLLASFASIVLVLTAATSASAARSTSIVLTGNDISYPQCTSKLPSGQAFGIVGVNDGLANTNNPCFSTELAWAQASSGLTTQPKAALYVNTANPGHSATVWPTDNTVYGQTVTNPYGTCDGSESAACAYIYGYTRAYEDANTRTVPSPATYKWWLDVETANSWSATDLTANTASLEGMTNYFTSIGAKVGIYSTAYQFNTIIGTLPSTSPLNGLESWIAGALTQKGAQSNCKSTPLTANGTVTVAQYSTKGLDYDIACQ